MNESYISQTIIENCDWEKIVRSRIWLEAECEYMETFSENFKNNDKYLKPYHDIIINEAQFLKPKEVDTFAYITDEYDIPVVCFGLRTNFQSKLFPWSQRLFELADEIIGKSTVCRYRCKARFKLEH